MEESSPAPAFLSLEGLFSVEKPQREPHSTTGSFLVFVSALPADRVLLSLVLKRPRPQAVGSAWMHIGPPWRITQGAKEQICLTSKEGAGSRLRGGAELPGQVRKAWRGPARAGRGQPSVGM